MTLSLADTNGYHLPEFEAPDGIWVVLDDDGGDLFWSHDEAEAIDAFERYQERGFQVELVYADDDTHQHGPTVRWLVIDCNGDEFNNARFATECEADARCAALRQQGYDAAVTVDDPDYDPTPF